MTATTAQSTPPDSTEAAYARACRLIETELGGRRLAPEPRTGLDDLTRTRRHKIALFNAIEFHCCLSSRLEAHRVVKAMYPYLDPHGFSTDAALTAAWNILEPDAHTWPKKVQNERRRLTDDRVTRALVEANTAVADHA
ncbi:hypothetical protein ACIRSS_23340 [Amycolatopsis sp. NPDC101161]|uniref:hypothetical protein n=1 Tax=Amycolatopsis sp. NPDC101161 TaxID=3363940 RepID=UPI00381D9077